MTTLWIGMLLFFGAHLTPMTPLRASLVAALGETLQAITKLKGKVELVAPGSLPNDGKVIADERPIG